MISEDLDYIAKTPTATVDRQDMVVGEIDDIIEQELTIQRKSLSPDIIGSAIIKDKVTEVLDVENMIKSADPSFYL